MKHNFTVEEVNLICIFAGESGSEVIEDIERALPYLDDTDMVELSGRITYKETGFPTHSKCGQGACFFMHFI